jgi:cob(I)alamin adenosyltransferase
MGNRLSKIVTYTGEKGETGLGNGERVSKDVLRIHALGEVDELNAYIGLLLCESLSEEMQTQLRTIQQDLFDFGGELSIPGLALICTTHITRLEKDLIQYNQTLPPLENFILPGGTRSAALMHVCRTVCRRVERTVVRLHHLESLNANVLSYINRLSDMFFVLARVLNQVHAQVEPLWEQEREV